jgi:nucleoside-diphosphate-sugar epimerase
LANGNDQVRCLVRETSQTAYLTELGLTLCYGSLSNKESLIKAMAGVDVVYHLAGQIYAGQSESFDKVNVDGTRNIIEAALAQATPPTIITTSSLAAAGPRVHTRPAIESEPPQPVSQYGRSKVHTEAILREYADQLPLTIVRPPMVIGGGDTASFPLFNSISKRLHTVVGSDSLFSVVYVKDLVDLMILLAEKGERMDPAKKDKGIYFACFDEIVTFTELGQQIANAMSVSKHITLRIPKWAVLGAGYSSDMIAKLTGKKMLFSADKAREGVGGNWICSPQKANSLGWQPSGTLQEALNQTVTDYRNLNML